MDHILAPREIHTRTRNLYHGYTQVFWANRDLVFRSLEEQRSLSVLDDAPRVVPRVVQRPESRIVCGGLVLMGKLYIRGRGSHCIPNLIYIARNSASALLAL